MHKETLKAHRIKLHQMPELGFDLFETSAYVRAQLESFGYEVFSTAKTGLVCKKEGASKEAIAFRSDMDALPVHEETQLAYRSKHPGRMHACGHDGHMSMLLGFAEYIQTLKSLKKTIVFIFQPAEEGPGGAKVIIEEGIFEKFHIKHIFGIHLYPGLEEGKYGLVDGPMMAQNGEFDITIKGTSAHGAQPHLGHDAVLIASELIQQYHTIVSRNIDPLEPAVVTIGTIGGGEARNIIAQEVKLTGTIRAFNEQVYQTIKTRMHQIDRGLSQAFDCDIDNHIVDYYPAVINDHRLFEMLKTHLNPKSYMFLKPMMFAEDFAFYQKKVPGMFVMLGTKNISKGWTHPLHSCYFNFEEDVLIKGVELYIEIAKLMDAI